MTVHSLRSTRSPGRRVARTRRREQMGAKLGAAVWIGGAGLAVVAMVGWTIVGGEARRASAIDMATLCPLERGATSETLVLLDQTDTLARDSGARFLQLFRRLEQELPRGARLTIMPFGGDLGQSLSPVFDACSPGQARDADEMVEGPKTLQRLYDEKFAGKLAAIAGSLQAPRQSDRSPIAEQIERAINDPAIHWSLPDRRLVIMTDGLQNTEQSTVYSGAGVTLPSPRPNLLAGVTVTYVELANATRPDLQTSTVREAWRRWFEAAGATVEMYAPGYAPPTR